MTDRDQAVTNPHSAAEISPGGLYGPRDSRTLCPGVALPLEHVRHPLATIRLARSVQGSNDQLIALDRDGPAEHGGRLRIARHQVRFNLPAALAPAVNVRPTAHHAGVASLAGPSNDESITIHRDGQSTPAGQPRAEYGHLRPPRVAAFKDIDQPVLLVSLLVLASRRHEQRVAVEGQAAAEVGPPLRIRGKQHGLALPATVSLPPVDIHRPFLPAGVPGRVPHANCQGIPTHRDGHTEVVFRPRLRERRLDLCFNGVGRHGRRYRNRKTHCHEQGDETADDAAGVSHTAQTGVFRGLEMHGRSPPCYCK